MTTLSFPAAAPEPRMADWWLQPNTQRHVSPLDKTTQTLELAGSRWRAELSYPPMDQDEWRAFTAFLAQARGSAGRIYVAPPYPARTARGTATGTPLVKGASQTGASLLTDGWTAGTLVLKAGDYFTVVTSLGSYELKIVTANVTSDGSGNATIAFEPPLRASPADNQPIIVVNPTCVMMLADDDQGRASYEEAAQVGLSLSMIEVF